MNEKKILCLTSRPKQHENFTLPKEDDALKKADTSSANGQDQGFEKPEID